MITILNFFTHHLNLENTHYLNLFIIKYKFLYIVQTDFKMYTCCFEFWNSLFINLTCPSLVYMIYVVVFKYAGHTTCHSFLNGKKKIKNDTNICVAYLNIYINGEINLFGFCVAVYAVCLHWLTCLPLNYTRVPAWWGLHCSQLCQHGPTLWQGN